MPNQKIYIIIPHKMEIVRHIKKSQQYIVEELYMDCLFNFSFQQRI